MAAHSPHEYLAVSRAALNLVEALVTEHGGVIEAMLSVAKSVLQQPDG